MKKITFTNKLRYSEIVLRTLIKPVRHTIADHARHCRLGYTVDLAGPWTWPVVDVVVVHHEE